MTSQIYIFALFLMYCSLAVSAKDKIELSQIRDGVWLHTSIYTYPNGKRFPSNGLVVKSEDGLILIDTAWGELKTVELLELIKLQIGIPVKKTIITHAHFDRLAGVDYLESLDVKVYSSSLTQKLAIQNGLPVPDIILESLNEINSIEIIDNIVIANFGPAHTPDNLIVWLPKSKTLFGGCAIRAMSSTSLGNIREADLNSWLAVMNKINLEFEGIELVVPGHGNIGDISLVDNTVKLINNRD